MNTCGTLHETANKVRRLDMRQDETCIYSTVEIARYMSGMQTYQIIRNMGHAVNVTSRQPG